MIDEISTLNFINGYATEEEADAARRRLIDPDKYVLFSIHKGDQSLFCWIPKIAGKIIFDNQLDD
jgi:hypothetical protein